MAFNQAEFEKFLGTLGKKYGEETFSIPKVEIIPSTSIGLNILTGVRGIPRGRIMEFYGPEHGGKTTIALASIAEANRRGQRAFFADVECALDKSWAAKLGVDWNLTTYVRAPSGEKAFDIICELVQSGYFALGVVDSVAALLSEVELESSMEDTKDRVGGYVAKIMSCGLRKLNSLVAPHNCGVIFINQVRDAIGTMYGDPESTPGGRALKFYSSIRIRVNKFTGADKVYKIGDIQVGHRCSIKLKKNKLGAPDSRDAEFDLYYSSGIDTISEMVEWAHRLKIAVKRGDSLTYKDQKLDVAAFKLRLRDEEDFRNAFLEEIYSNARNTGEAMDDEPVTKEDLQKKGLL